MANNKRLVSKNGFGAQSIQFTSPDGTKVITMQMLDTNVLSSDGDLVANDFVRPSDQRLKDNIQPLDAKQKLNPVTFNWKDSGTSDIGFIAGDVASAYPEVIKYFERDGIIYQAVAYDKLTAVLAAQLNRAMDEIQSLKKEIEEIKAKLD